ncbi:MAG: hypothetical protein COA52_00495 [Hyphomicrobiales bacterium]|nr:MAG: hypothetical protein COA52_00495 [Hyphomicrobiales bacterium]
MNKEYFMEECNKILIEFKDEKFDKNIMKKMIDRLYHILKENNLVGWDIVCDEQLNSKKNIDDGVFNIGINPKGKEIGYIITIGK